MDHMLQYFEELPTDIGAGEPPRLKVVFATMEWVTRATLWRPPTDVLETENSILVKLEVAGMQAGEFTLSVQPRLLAVRGNRTANELRGAYHQMEINSGEFISVVELASPVDIHSLQATYRDGFLVVVLAKRNA